MSEIKKVGIIGSGTMGTGIAQLVASSGYLTILMDISDELLVKSIGKIKKSLTRLVEKERISADESEKIISNIRTTTSYNDLSDCEILIEAVPEIKQVKKEVYSSLEKSIGKNSIIATNTSSLSVTELGHYTSRPEKFIGIHFFNPAPVMKLVEIVSSPAVSPATVKIAKDFAVKLGKDPVFTKDSRGFIVNRILIPMINEAISVLDEGVATAEDIDKAMMLGSNQPMGPLALADFIGLDITLDILDIFYEEFNNPKYSASPLLREKVKAGHLGRKSGKGFFDYS